MSRIVSPRTASAINLTIGVAVLCGAVADIAGLPIDSRLWAVVLAAYLILNFRGLRVSGLVMTGLAVAAMVFYWLTTGEIALEGMVRAGLFFALLLQFQYLGRLADRTEEVAKAGELIVSRPPGQRYLFTTFGSQILSVPLNLGGLLIVNTLLRSRADSLGPETHRSLVVASMRGFASTTLWSPFSLGVLIILSAVGGVDYLHFAAIGLITSIVYLLVGYRMERRGIAAARRNADYPAADRKMIGSLLIGVGLLCAAIAAIARVSHLELLQVVFLVLLAGAVAWTIMLIRRRLLEAGSIGDIVAEATGNSTNEIAIICGSMVLGVVAASVLIGGSWLDSGFGTLEATLASALVPAIIFLGGALAINPIVSATIIAGSLAVVWPESAKIWLILTIIWGWVTTTCGTPFTANMLLIAQMLGTSSARVAYAWNGRFTIVTLAIFTALATAGTFLSTV